MLAIPAMTNLAHIHALLPNSQLHNIGIAEARDRQISQIATNSSPTVGWRLSVPI